MKRIIILFFAILGVSCLESDPFKVASKGDTAPLQIQTQLIKPVGQFGLKSPEGIAVNEDYVVITNVNYENFAYGDGYIVVFDRQTLTPVNKLLTTQLNPQKAIFVDDVLYVVNSGASQFNAETFLVEALSDGGVDVIAASRLKTAVAFDQNIPIPLGADRTKGNPFEISVTPDKTTAYIGSGLYGILYKIDLKARILLSGNENPILVSPEYTSIHLSSVRKDGILFVGSFNSDLLYAFDTRTDTVSPSPYAGPISVGASSELMEGIQAIAITDGQPDVYVLLTMANSVTAVDSLKIEAGQISAEAIIRDFATVGLYANALKIKGNLGYVVNSGDNNLIQINLSTREVSTVAVMPDGANPWDVEIDIYQGQKYIYITNYMDNSITAVYEQ